MSATGVLTDFRADSTKKIADQPIPFDATGGDVAVSTANAAAVLTYVADATPRPLVLAQIFASLQGTTPTAILTVKDGTTVVWETAIGDTSPHTFEFRPPRSNTPGNTMTITLAAGGSGVIGYLSANVYRMK